MNDRTTPMNSPQPGPLTSTEGLLPGDLLRVVTPGIAAHFGPLVRFERAAKDIIRAVGLDHHFRHFAFVARPGVWQDWTGGENPAGDEVVDVCFADGTVTLGEPADEWDWTPGDILSIIRWRIPEATPTIEQSSMVPPVDWEVVGPKLVEALREADAAARTGASMAAADYTVSAEWLGERIYSITTPAIALAATQGEGEP